MGFSAICFSHKDLLIRNFLDKVKKQCSSPLTPPALFYRIQSFYHFNMKPVLYITLRPMHIILSQNLVLSVDGQRINAHNFILIPNF